MEIIIFESPAIPGAVRPALVAEGHHVYELDRDDGRRADLVVLDASRWSVDAIVELSQRMLGAEVVTLVDSLEDHRPSNTMALLKPLDVTKLVRLVRVVDEARSGRADPRDLVDFETLFAGDSPAIVDLLRQVRLLAQSDAPVWLHGELGCGRVVVARAIHERSLRQRKAFVAINAASFPGDHLEEHLFGCGDRAGAEPLAMRAAGGTLFVDCVTDLAPGVQAKLLRLLEERLLRLDTGDQKLDVRIMVGDERRSLEVGDPIRRELAIRLKVHELDLPPLRERQRDLHAIIERLLGRLRTDGRPALSPSAARALSLYPFPGNVRELAHALTHAVVVSQGGQIELDHLPMDIQEPHGPAAAADEDLETLEALDVVAKRFERDYLLRVLRAVGGNRTRAAKVLSLSRKGLWQKLKAHGIPADEGRESADAEETDLG